MADVLDPSVESSDTPGCELFRIADHTDRREKKKRERQRKKDGHTQTQRGRWVGGSVDWVEKKHRP